jgi:hypothetical protein
MEQNKADYTIFTKPLEPYAPKRKLKHLRNGPSSYIVRNVTGGIYGRTSYSDAQFHKLYEEKVDVGEQNARHLKKVQEHGINIPPTYFVAGADSFNYLRLYSLTKEVKGYNLKTYVHLQNANEQQLAISYNKLIISLCSYYENQFWNNQMVMDDIADIHQYKIITDNEEPIIYLIDTDINISEPCQNLAKDTINKLTNSADILSSKFRTGNNFMQPSYAAIDDLKLSIFS